MASIHREIVLAAAPAAVWSAFRDVGAVHTRLARGFVTDTRLDGDSRIVTFFNGMVARERIVDVDDGQRRLAYAIVEGRPTHHHASFQVFDAPGGGSRVVWIADVLPDDLKEAIAGMMDRGLVALKETLDTVSSRA